MKTLKKLLFFIAGIGLLIACSKSDHFWGDEPLGNTDEFAGQEVAGQLLLENVQNEAYIQYWVEQC